MATSDPKEDAVPVSPPEFGNEFTPYDRQLQQIQMKLPRVLEGREKLTYRELELLIARLYVGR